MTIRARTRRGGSTVRNQDHEFDRQAILRKRLSVKKVIYQLLQIKAHLYTARQSIERVLAVGTASPLAIPTGAQTIGIVDSPTNPVAGTAEHVIVAPSRTVGRMPSWTTHAAVLHGLIQALTLRRITSVTDWVLKTNQLMRDYVDELEKSVEPMRQAMLALDRPNNE